ncbi:ChrR family anti-sigma-E factor [Brevundimonas sp.]|uniref:cadmium/peroxide/UV radiation responsive anti-sigma factor ChrR n=1 Tax=Brevundimonas sp. TaxID=1871086 RepID=UPI0028974E64|nr:ChrR family anti-sigma-E factor [Brevundimonas sp.]
MAPTRMISEELLTSYANGTISAPEALVVSTHLALRPAHDVWVRQLQAIGGELLDTAAPAAMSDQALTRTLSMLDACASEVEQQQPLNEMSELPEPLRRYALGPWRWVGPGIRVRDVHAPRDGDTRVILLKINPGCETPKHTHGGVELTCVLSGAYATETERFDVGDLEEADGDVLHQPRVISDEPCLCVVALDGQIKIDGWIGRLIQPFVRL